MVGSAELEEPKSEPPFLPASARKGGSGSTTRYLWSSYFEWKFLLGDALDEVETLNLEKKAFAQLRKNITTSLFYFASKFFYFLKFDFEQIMSSIVNMRWLKLLFERIFWSSFLCQYGGSPVLLRTVHVYSTVIMIHVSKFFGSFWFMTQ